jgi:TRAP-type C4-dicarboxylate transport system substrate-binding protein
VDGQENPVGLIESAKFYEVQKYLSLTQHAFTAMPVLMSKRTWDRLSEEERKVIREAAEEAKLVQRKAAAEKEAADLEKLKKHMQVSTLSAQEIDGLRRKIQPVVDKYTNEVGMDLVQQVQAEITKVRGGK